MRGVASFVSYLPLRHISKGGKSRVQKQNAPTSHSDQRTPLAVAGPARLRPRPKKEALPGQPGHRFYDFKPDDVEAVRIRHCRVDTEALCSEVFHQVTNERLQLADVARTLSTCQASKDRGGDLGWWWKDEVVPGNIEEFGIDEKLLAAALRTRPNKLDRVETSHGWHVYVVEEVRHVLRTKHERNPSRENPNRPVRKEIFNNIPVPIPKTYSVQTLGCQMNRADSERMAGELIRKGYTEIENPFQSSVLVLNTCNIRDHAESKVYSYIGRHVERKRKSPAGVTLCVAGCVAQQEGEKILRRIPELDLVFGPQYVNRLGDLLEDVERNHCQVAATDPIHIQEDISKPKRESTVTAWVNVMYGCGENCSFCTVGNVVRTVEQSRTIAAIRAEIEEVSRAGIREVVLLGQNIDAYGRDMYPKKTFAELLRHIHDVEGIDRVRFTTSHPRYISRNLVSTCAELPKIMPFFHIPPQSGDNAILKEMKRGYSVESFLAVIERIREYIPDAGICGDMIVGFPGESEEQFQHSLDLLEEVKFDMMNTAAYSPRPKTPAAEMDCQIPDAIKAERLQRMNQVVSKHALERSMRYVGRTENVLVEHANPKNPREVIGRTPTNRSVYFEGLISDLKGSIVPVEIIEAFPFSLKGKAVVDAF